MLARLPLIPFVSLLIFCFFLADSAHAERAPRLGVVVVIDQLRGDEIAAHEALWTGGFRRLLQEGTWFSDAEHAHARTETAAGHASVGTGMTPRHHGIVDKRIYDRKSRRVRRICRMGDVPCDPALLLAPTVGDRLKQISPASQVVAVSQKDRAAALLGGKRADLVAWFDKREPRLRGRSAAGTAGVPGWLQDAFMATASHDKIAPVWTLPALPGIYASWKDDRPGERGCGHGLVFPHALPQRSAAEARWSAWWCTPDSDRVVREMAEAVVDRMGMGADAVPDLLYVSFSAVDEVGHAFGPFSRERVAVLQALDVQLGRLMAKLEAATDGDVFMMLTADHGVTPILDHLKGQGRKGGRVDVKALKRFVDRGLRRKFGRGRYVEAISVPYLFLESRLSPELRAKAAAYAVTLLEKDSRIFKAYVTKDLDVESSDPIERRLYANAHPVRAGEVSFAFKEDFTRARSYYAGRGAHHGSAWRDDSHVPVLFWGRGISQWKVDSRITVPDAVRAFSDRMGIPPDPRGGKPLKL